jgi:Zn-dependent peptidase ImmA (M78 family)/transcriptional regulator with XRE-family HTH domain
MPSSTHRVSHINTNDIGHDLAYINPKILKWAIARSGITKSHLAEKLNCEESHIEQWENATPIPFEKARKAAKLLQVPFGYFYLPTVPDDGLPLPDRRRRGDRKKPTPEFLQLLNDVLVRQDWYLDHLKSIGQATKKGFVGSYGVSSRVADVAADIRNTLKIKSDLRNTISSWSEYMSALVRNAEDVGILVMRSSIVGNSTTRHVRTEEMQGFAIADEPAVPLVFINSEDYKASQIFTLAHELAHVWIGQSAITKTNEVEPDTDQIEAFCNRVAVDVLVPPNEFQYAWDSTSPARRLDILPRRFWVSSLVILRRARETGRITATQFQEMLESEREKMQTVKRAGGGDFYRTLFVRMGNKFTHSVVRELAKNNLLIRDAARLLSVAPKTLPKLLEVAK